MEFNLTFLTTAAPGRLLECIMPLEGHTSISSDMGTGWKVTPSMGLRLNFLPVLQRCTDAVLQTHTSGTEMYKGESGKRFRLFFWKLKGYSKLCKLLPYFLFPFSDNRPSSSPHLQLWAGARPLKTKATSAHPGPFQPSLREVWSKLLHHWQNCFCLFVCFLPPKENILV